MARDNNMSQLDYLWTYFGKYKVSEQVSDNPSDENILTEKALLDFINASILSRKVVSTLLYRKSNKPNTMEIVGVGTDGAEVTSIEVPAEVHVEKFEIRLITQEDIEKGSEIPLDSKVLSLVLTNGTEFLVSLEQLNLEIQGYESDTIKTDVVNHVVKSDLKINKGNNTLSVVKIRTNNDGIWGDLEVSPKTTGVVLTKQVNGLEASIPIQNTENNIQFMQLTLEHYLGLATKDPGMVYFITDKPYIYLSGMRYGLDVQQGTYLITGLSFDQEKMALIVSYLGKENEEVPIGEATEDSNGLMTSQMVQSLKECIKYKETVDNYTVNGHKISENPILTKQDVGLENVDNTSDLNKPISTATQAALDKVKEDLEQSIGEGSETITSHISNKSNPHEVTKAQVGLSRVDNTNDLEKPVSTATQELVNTTKVELTEKITSQGELINSHIADKNNPHGITKKTIDLENVDNTSDANKPISTATQRALDELDSRLSESVTTHIADKSNPHQVTKEQVGLANVDNTSDANKPVSTATQNALNTKVDKVDGKQLSTEDYTTAEKTKLQGIADNANNYSHPAGSAPSKTEGLYKISTDSNSHIASATPVAKSDITALGIPAQDTTYSDATTSQSGLMSGADKTKLDGIANNANNYSHPDTHPASIIVEDESHKFVTDSEKAAWNSKSNTFIILSDPSVENSLAYQISNTYPDFTSGEKNTINLIETEKQLLIDNSIQLDNIIKNGGIIMIKSTEQQGGLDSSTIQLVSNTAYLGNIYFEDFELNTFAPFKIFIHINYYWGTLTYIKQDLL